MSNEFGFSSLASCGSGGPMRALQPFTASSRDRTINMEGPLEERKGEREGGRKGGERERVKEGGRERGREEGREGKGRE